MTVRVFSWNALEVYEAKKISDSEILDTNRNTIVSLAVEIFFCVFIITVF